jgi:hypothetical protein
MRNSVVIGCGIMLTAVLVGCGSSGPDATVKDMISAMNEQASLMESKADKSKIEAAVAHVESLKKKLDGFSKEQVATAIANHKEELAKAQLRVVSAMGLGDLFKGFNPKDFKMPKLP